MYPCGRATSDFDERDGVRGLVCKRWEEENDVEEKVEVRTWLCD